MKQIIKLNEKDIIHLVAKEFHADEKQVSIYLEKTLKGYGLGEHEDYEVCVIVNK